MNRSKVRVRVRVRVRCSTTCDNLGLSVMTMVGFASQCILLHNIKINCYTAHFRRHFGCLSIS